ncbi:MAG: Hsp20/alpha crystallin family protein [Christensenellales bacterium]|jgi:HSP20 family protein
MQRLVPTNRNRGLRPFGVDGFFNMPDDFFDPWFPGRHLMRDTFRVDVQENDNEYTVEAEIPGVKKEDVRLELTEGRLLIAVQREDNVEEEKKNYIHRERHFSSAQRCLHLPDAKPEGIKAKMDDGVLRITVPKEEKSNSRRRIDIQ